MAKSYEASGKTVDEAIDIACILAGTTIENVEIEILSLGGKGLFGFGQKDARVRVTLEDKETIRSIEPTSTFGIRKSRKELREKKPFALDIEIKPIIVVEPTTDGKAAAKADINNFANASNRHEGYQSKDRSSNSRYQEHSNYERSHSGDRNRSSYNGKRESFATTITEGEMADNIFVDVNIFVKPIFEEMGVNPTYRTEIREGILWIRLFVYLNLGLYFGCFFS